MAAFNGGVIVPPDMTIVDEPTIPTDVAPAIIGTILPTASTPGSTAGLIGTSQPGRGPVARLCPQPTPIVPVACLPDGGGARRPAATRTRKGCPGATQCFPRTSRVGQDGPTVTRSLGRYGRRRRHHVGTSRHYRDQQRWGGDLGRTLSRARPDRPGGGAGQHTHRADAGLHTADGTVGYREIGTGSPLLLIMGYGGSLDNWAPDFVDELAQAHTVVMLDNSPEWARRPESPAR